MNKLKRRRRPAKPKREFTKQIVAAVLLTYFLGVAIGAVVVLSTAPDQLYAYLTFIGAPTATTVGFYCWKAKNENMNKHPSAITQPPETPAENDEEV